MYPFSYIYIHISYLSHLSYSFYPFFPIYPFYPISCLFYGFYVSYFSCVSFHSLSILSFYLSNFPYAVDLSRLSCLSFPSCLSSLYYLGFLFVYLSICHVSLSYRWICLFVKQQSFCMERPPRLMIGMCRWI